MIFIHRSMFIGTVAVMVLARGLAGAGEVDPAQHKWYEKYKDQENIPLPEEMLLNTDPEPELIDGFTSLFNGKDLTGWDIGFVPEPR